MSKLTYPGPAAHIDVVSLGCRVERGASVDVDDEVLVDQLLDQGWVLATPASKPPTIAEVLDQVDGDPSRAVLALEAEQARPKPRQKLLDQLTELAATPATQATTETLEV